MILTKLSAHKNHSAHQAFTALSVTLLITVLLFAGCASDDAAVNVLPEEDVPPVTAPVPELPAALPEVPSEPEPEPEPGLSVIPMYQKKLLVAFYPGVHEDLKTAIAKSIEDSLKLTVVTAEFDHGESEVGMRDVRDNYMQDYIHLVRKACGQAAFDRLCRDFKMSDRDLKTKEGREKFVLKYCIMCSDDPDETEALFDSMKPQYNADILIDETRWDFELTGDFIGALAVTAQDMFKDEADTDFTYGYNTGSIGVMSTMRLTKEGSKALCSERVVKQALTTVADILRIPHCEDDSCVRTDTWSLEDTDAKRTILCDDCINEINAKYTKWL